MVIPEVIDLKNSKLEIGHEGDRIVFGFAGDLEGDRVSFSVRLAEGAASLPIHEFVANGARLALVRTLRSRP